MEKNSFTTLLGITSLVFNLIIFIAFSPPFRTLIHQYNLPIALIGSISVIEGISKIQIFQSKFLQNILIALCWFALAKPYFFLGPYLSRVDSISQINKLIKNFSYDKSILTTSYIAPHLKP